MVGHTQLDPKAVQPALATLLQRIRETATSCFQSPTARLLYAGGDRPDASPNLVEPVFRFTSCLAPGADQVGTEIAHGLGYQTVALLPLPREQYGAVLERSEGRERREEFERLLADRVDHCLELPGYLVDQCERQDVRYAFVARMLVDHVDLLIAVWCGPEEEQKRDGVSLTARAIELARERNVPVVWIPAGAVVAGRDVGSGPVPHRFANALVGRRAWTQDCPTCQADLQSRLQALLDPYGAAGPDGDEAGLCQGTEGAKLRVRHGLGMRVGAALARLLHPLLRFRKGALAAEWNEHTNAELALVRDHLRLEVLRRAVAALDYNPRPHGWQVPFLAVARVFARQSPFVRWMRSCEPPNATSSAPSRVPASHLGQLMAVANRHSVQLMERYRSNFSWIFFLGALAVLLAIAAYLGKTAGSTIGVVYAALELGIVLLILGLYFSAHVFEWQARALDFRLVAELLRQARWVDLAYVSVPRPRLAGHVRAPHEPQHWPQWYVQAILREHDFGFAPSERRRMVTTAGLAQIRSDIREHLVRDQERWYDRKGLQHSIFAHRAHAWEMWIFLCVAVACAGAIILCFAPFEVHQQAWYRLAAGFLVVITASFPAFASAIHGLSVQAELESIAKNYQRMVGALRARGDALDGLGDHFTIGDLQREVAMASNAMLAEVQDWHRSYGDHPPPLV